MASDSNIYGGLYFNPRPREEGDAVEGYVFSSDSISIHALVKRATLVSLSILYRAFDFNPRPREEGDVFNDNFHNPTVSFQSTPS